MVSGGGALRGAQTVIPPPANPWAARSLYVSDKDTNSIIINANDLYVASLQPLFPAIQSVTNLIGHDDFYLYPADLATKYRADDARVMASGSMFVTDEPNQPAGGVRTIVRVIKIPLRNSTGDMVGLRAIWFTQPPLTYSNSADGLVWSFPADADLFRLERRNDLGPSAVWTAQTVLSNAVSGHLTYPVSAPGAQGFFRLAADRVVRLGALLSLTGPGSDLGRNCQAAIRVGLETLNLQQFSSGSPLYFNADVRDTHLDPATALTQLQSLAADGVQVVLGPQSSAELQLLKPFADAHGLLLISPSSTTSSLALTNDNVFRFCPDDTDEATALATLLQQDGVQAVVPLWRDDADNQGLRDALAALFPAQGGTVYAGVKYSAGETNFAAAVADLSSQVAGALSHYPGQVAVYLAGGDEVAAVFKSAQTNSLLASVNWYGGDEAAQSAALASDTLAAAFAAAHGFPCPLLSLDERFRPVWEPLAIWIKSQSGLEVGAFTLAAYDALQVTAAAYLAVGSNPAFDDLKAAWLQAADQYSGATGPTTLNPAGDRNSGAFDFWSLKAGSNGYVWFRSASFEPGSGSSGTITRYP